MAMTLRRSLVVTAVLLCLGVNVSAQSVTYETSHAPTGVNFLEAGETENINVNAGTGTNRLLSVCVCWRDRGNTPTATYNSTPMTPFGAALSQGVMAARLFYLHGPASGTNVLAVTMTAGGGGSSDAIISAHVVNTVDSGTPIDGYTTGNGSGSSANIVSSVTITSATNDAVVTFHCTQNGTGNISATASNFTERQDANNGGGYSTVLGDAAGAASVATSATWSNGAFNVNWIALGFNANVAATGGATVPKMMLLGVGGAW